jgi:hypothetical protein
MLTNMKVVGLAAFIVALNLIAVTRIGLGYDRFDWIVFSQAYDLEAPPPPPVVEVGEEPLAPPVVDPPIVDPAPVAPEAPPPPPPPTPTVTVTLAPPPPPPPPPPAPTRPAPPERPRPY